MTTKVKVSLPPRPKEYIQDLYKLYTGVKNEQGKKLYVGEGRRGYMLTSLNAISFTDYNELEMYLFDNEKKLKKFVQNNDLYLSVEKNGSVKNMTANELGQLDFNIDYINTSWEEIEKERKRRLKDLKVKKYMRKNITKYDMLYVSVDVGHTHYKTIPLEDFRDKEAVKKVLKETFSAVPYWVIVVPLWDGGLSITVLSVSMRKGDWKRERLTKKKHLEASTYNTSGKFTSSGVIKLRREKNGSIRVVSNIF